MANRKASIQEVELAFIPLGAHQQDTSVDTATTLSAPTGAEGATKMLIQALTQNVRMTLDGTVPTTSKGFRLTAGNDPILIPISTSTTVKVISETSGAAVEYQFGD